MILIMSNSLMTFLADTCAAQCEFIAVNSQTAIFKFYEVA